LQSYPISKGNQRRTWPETLRNAKSRRPKSMSAPKTCSGSRSCSMQRSRWTHSRWRSRTAAPQTSTSSLPRYSWREASSCSSFILSGCCAKASGLAALGVDRDAAAICDFAYSDNWLRGNAPCERDRNRHARLPRSGSICLSLAMREAGSMVKRGRPRNDERRGRSVQRLKR
jgi:hypothetical protein